MSKFKISQSGTTLKIDYGGGILNIRNGERLGSVLVDVGMSSTKVCLQRKSNHGSIINIFELEGYSYSEVSELLSLLISAFKVESLHMDYRGAGLGVYDFLIPDLINKGIYISDDGTLIYNLNSEQINALVKGSQKVYYSRLP